MGKDVTTPAVNFYAAYAAAARTKTFVGALLKFLKGIWLAGKDGGELPIGTTLVAIMSSLVIGWQRWENGKPTEVRLGRLCDGFEPPRRRDLGDIDQDEWERDANGVLRDPWCFINSIALVDPNNPARIFTFTTSSRGGISAITDLCGAYGSRLKHEDGEYPVVELKRGSYPHSNRSYGMIPTPVLDVVSWVKRGPFDAAYADAAGVDVASLDASAAAAPAGYPGEPVEPANELDDDKPTRPARQSLSGQLDDDIPW